MGHRQIVFILSTVNAVKMHLWGQGVTSSCLALNIDKKLQEEDKIEGSAILREWEKSSAQPL